jgi:excisionase family DNA binding protein
MTRRDRAGQRRLGGRAFATLAVGIGLLIAGGACSAHARSESAPSTRLSTDDEVLTLEEAAALLEVGTDTLEALAESGEIPGRRLREQWRFSRARLLEWLAAANPSSASEGTPAALSESELRARQGRGPDGDPPEGETVGEPPPNETASDIFLRNRRVLLAPGQIVLEPAISYTRADTPDIQFQSFASADGIPVSAAVGEASNIQQDITTASLTGRSGLLEGFEGFAGLIFQDRRIKSDSEPDSVDTELRSVFFGLRATVLREAQYRPDLVLGVQGIAPTGDSSAGVAASLFAIKSEDPIALFAGVDYLHTFSRDFDEPRLLEPEDTIAAQVGYVFAVTDRTSLNTSVQGLFILDSHFDAGQIDSNEEFSLRLGLTQRLRADLFVEPNVAFSLNGPGDFVILGLRIPWIAYP